MTPIKCLTEEQLQAELREQLRLAGSQLALAEELGISPQYLNDILHRGRALGPKVLRALGYRRVTVYEPLTPALVPGTAAGGGR